MRPTTPRWPSRSFPAAAADLAGVLSSAGSSPAAKPLGGGPSAVESGSKSSAGSGATTASGAVWSKAQGLRPSRSSLVDSSMSPCSRRLISDRSSARRLSVPEPSSAAMDWGLSSSASTTSASLDTTTPGATSCVRWMITQRSGLSSEARVRSSSSSERSWLRASRMASVWSSNADAGSARVCAPGSRASSSASSRALEPPLGGSSGVELLASGSAQNAQNQAPACDSCPHPPQITPATRRGR